MKKSDFITDYTEDYTNALNDAIKQAKRCEYFTAFDLTKDWRISYPHYKPQHISEMDAEELYLLTRHLNDMAEELEKFIGFIDEMATAKNELESVDLYEFEDDE